MSEEALRRPSNNPSALPIGTRLGEFELLSLLGIGGFGIVYLAFDHALEREVAIKEYMPASLAGRTATMHVSILSHGDAESFALGLRSFVNEARLLARFDHPSLLKVHRFWEANGTAYMAMPVMRGRTVKDVRLEMSFPPDEAWMRALLDPLLGALEKLHSEGVYHRDIAPDNIQIEPDGHPVLLDFGAARRVLTDKSQALTAILKPAYAPIEQYGEAGAVKQGPWTDIYALGATLHFLLLTYPPAPATARAIQDEASSLTTAALPGCSENFLRIIDWMLAPRPGDRPQSVAELREVLEGRAPTPMRRPPPQDLASDWDRTVIAPAAPMAATQRHVQAPTAPPPPTAGPVAPVWPPQDNEDEDATVILPTPIRPPQGDRTVFAPPPAATVPPPVPTTAYTPTPSPAPPAHAPAVAPAQRYPDAGQVTIRVPPPASSAARPPAPPPEPRRDTAAAQGGKSRAMPIALALGAIVVAGAAVFGLTRKAPAPAAEAPAAAASVAVPVPPPPAPAETRIEPPAPAPVAEVPAASAPPAVVAAPPAQATTVPNPASSGPTMAKAPANKATAPVRAASVAQAAPAGTAAAAPQPEAVRPRPDAQPLPPSASAAEAPKPVAAGPEARCAGRSALSYFVCMEKECLKSEQLGHADCKKWRQNARNE